MEKFTVVLTLILSKEEFGGIDGWSLIILLACKNLTLY